MKQRWLARLSMSFFVIAVLLLWEAYRARAEGAAGPPTWRTVLLVVGASVCVALGVAGVRARHRS